MDINKRQVLSQEIKLILSALIGGLGSGIFSFGIGLMILRETGSASNFGFSQMIGPVVSLILLPFTGSIVDKYNHKKIVVVAKLASIIGIILFLAGTHYQLMPRLIMIYMLLIVLRLSDLFLYTSYSSSMISMIPEDHIQKIMSYRQMVQTITGILSPILGALLYQLLTFEAFVGIEIISEVLTLGIVLILNFYLFTPSQEAMAEHQEDIADQGIKGMVLLFKEGINYIKQSSALVFIVVFSMFVNITFSAVNVGLPYLQVEIFQFTDIEFGITEMMFSIGILLAGLVLSQMKEIKKQLYYAWLLVFPIQIFILILSLLSYFQLSHRIQFISLTILLFIVGGLIGAINIPMGIWMTKKIPQKMQGRVFNILSTGSQLLIPIGILIFGALLDSSISTEISFAVYGLIGIIITYSIPKIIKINLKEIE